MIEASLTAAYDAVAARYAESIPGRYHGNPLHHAMTSAFAALVAGGGPVADVGCGPGHVTAHLHSLGVSAFGVDLSPEMVALARAAHPDLRFEVGRMESLDVATPRWPGYWPTTRSSTPRPSCFPRLSRSSAACSRPAGICCSAFRPATARTDRPRRTTT
ncbi:class I SAM-dependent methyltransferase [Nonomuraea sp. NPDC049709]|uniref:class I SAM-dependent methyltransferase n=1 Tax=Nonomuraea sp. NPDC049709 TaxID=3154736 RepID=UPI00341FDF2E